MTGKELMKQEAKLLEALISERNLLKTALEKCSYGVQLYGSREDQALVAKALSTTQPVTAQPAVPEGWNLNWSENKKPTEECRYDHCTAETPFGKFLLTWKGWKKYDSVCADETPWGDFFRAFDTLEEAKAECEAEYVRRLRLATTPKKDSTK
jgi:hypothetical protein